jgi:hypothetical protein
MKTASIVAVLLVWATAARGQPTKTVDRTVPLSPVGSATLQTHNGSIGVQTWDRPEVQIHVRIEAGGLSPNTRRLDQATVDVQSTSDSIWITSRYPTIASWWWWWSWFDDSPRFHYSIMAPKSARWTIRGHNATADIRGVHAALTVEMHNGRVHISDLDGPLRVDAHNGSVTADLVSFSGADFTSHRGSVDLALPATAAFNLHANTGRAGLQSDFPLAIRTLGRRRTHVEGAVNGGGPSLRFMSHSAELRLRSKG